jgi:hypothetical protein
MKRILLATAYSNLYGISLYNIQAETAIDLLTGKIFHFDSSIDRH